MPLIQQKLTNKQSHLQSNLTNKGKQILLQKLL